MPANTWTKALESGAIIDLTREGHEAGVPYRVAISAVGHFVAIRAGRVGCDERQQRREITRRLHVAMGCQPDVDSWLFKVPVLDDQGQPLEAELRAMRGPCGGAEPVVVIQLREEH